MLGGQGNKMPTTKKRVNLTIPDDVYDELQEYKQENALDSDATACLQLVKLQLRGQKTSKIMLEAMSKMSRKDVIKLSQEGLNFALDELEQSKTKRKK